MDVYKLIREGERKALKAYFSGEPLDQICRRFGYSRVRLQAMAEDYKSGKIDIFGPMDKKKIDNQLKEVDLLKARVAELEEALKISKIKAEGYEIMMRLIREEYGIDLPKKVEAKQSASSKSDIRK
jgi:hypothetical protein